MKKITFWVVFVMLLLVTGCGNNVKDVKSLDDFYNTATKKELIVSDNMINYSADFINGAMIASIDDLTVEMVIYDSNEEANKVQKAHIKSFANMKSTNAIIKKYKGKNYYKYTMITNGYYLVTSRVDNTLIFTKTLIKNKDMVDSIIQEMGY